MFNSRRFHSNSLLFTFVKKKNLLIKRPICFILIVLLTLTIISVKDGCVLKMIDEKNKDINRKKNVEMCDLFKLYIRYIGMIRSHNVIMNIHNM